MRALPIPVLLLALGVLVPCARAADGGESLATGPFHAVSIRGRVDVELVQGATEAVRVEAATGVRAQMSIRADGDTLRIESREERRLLGGERPAPRVVVSYRTIERVASRGEVTITMGKAELPALTITSSGAARVAIGALTAQRFELEGSGALTAEVAGRVDAQAIRLQGAGRYRGRNLQSRSAKVEITGAGRASVHALERLDATVVGAGVVEYLGTPAVERSTVGAGVVRPLEDDDDDEGTAKR